MTAHCTCWPLSCLPTVPFCPNRPTHLRSHACDCRLATNKGTILTLFWWIQFCLIKKYYLSIFYVHILPYSIGLPILCSRKLFYYLLFLSVPIQKFKKKKKPISLKYLILIINFGAYWNLTFI